MKNILVVNVNWLGDVIFSSPVFKALKESYPDARISCLAVPRVREALECIPFVDDIITYDEKGIHANPFAKLKLIDQLRKSRFDIAFLLHRSMTRALLVFLAGIPRRVGYDEKGRGVFLTHKVPSLKTPVHRSDHYLNVIESYGVKVNDRKYQLRVPDGAKKDIDELLKANNISKDEHVIAVNPGGNWDLKRWPIKNYRQLVGNGLNFKKATIIITGQAKDKCLSEQIMKSNSKNMVDLTGQTDLKQLMALMERCDLVISADSGPLHIASSVGTDVVAIFGPTSPEVTGPRGNGRTNILRQDVGCNRTPCYHLTCNDNICMQSITVNDVQKAVKQIRNS